MQSLLHSPVEHFSSHSSHIYWPEWQYLWQTKESKILAFKFLTNSSHILSAKSHVKRLKNKLKMKIWYDWVWMVDVVLVFSLFYCSLRYLSAILFLWGMYLSFICLAGESSLGRKLLEFTKNLYLLEEFVL